MVTKIHLKILFVLITTSMFFNNIYCQTDNNVIKISEENKDSSDYNYRRIYQYLDNNMKNEKRMIKVAPGYSISKNFQEIGTNLSYEAKIKKVYSFSVLNSSFYYREKIFGNYFSSTFSFQFRYYPTLKKRIESGISGNNLSGIYIGFSLDNLLYYQKGTNVHVFYAKDFRSKYTFHYGNLEPKLSIGIQRRFNNWSYFDIYSSIYFYDKYWFSNLGFRIGLAFGNNLGTELNI